MGTLIEFVLGFFGELLYDMLELVFRDRHRKHEANALQPEVAEVETSKDLKLGG
jgi:hypothetical protein